MTIERSAHVLGCRPEGPWPVTPECLELAKMVLWEGWNERAQDRGEKEPEDLSRSCKFSSLFVWKLFGGQIRGNELHQFLRLSSGKILDLNADARDVQDLADPWRHDPEFWGNEDHLESLESCLPRVDLWVERFEILARSAGIARLNDEEVQPSP